MAIETKDKLVTLEDLKASHTYLKSELSDVRNTLNHKADVIYDTASGDIASFPDGADGLPVKDLTVGIEPVQDLHGYENPWPGGGGKNLLDVPTSVTVQDNTFTIGTDYKISVSPNNTDPRDWAYSNAQYKLTLPSGSYKVVVNTITSVDNSNAGITVFDQAGTTLFFEFNSFQNVGIRTFDFTLEAETNLGIMIKQYTAVFTLMIVKSTESDLTYTPYSNICPISGWTGANVYRDGKNWIDGEFESGRIDSNGNNMNDDTRRRSVNYSPVVGGMTYILSKNGIPLSVNIARYDKDKHFIAMNGPVQGVKTLENNACFIRIYGTPEEITEGIQLELGSTATVYEPYSGTTLPISWQSEAGTVYGGTLDVTSGVLTVDRASYTFSTNSNWAKSGNTWSCNDIDSVIKPNVNNTTKPNIVSTILVADTPDHVWGGFIDGSISVARAGDGRSIRIYLSSLVDATASDVASFMAGSAIVYELATPQTYQLTPQEVTTLLGQNNIWADCGPVEVDAPRDTRLYIDRKISEAVTNLLNV